MMWDLDIFQYICISFWVTVIVCVIFLTYSFTCTFESLSTVWIHWMQYLTAPTQMEFLASQSSAYLLARASLEMDIICSRENASFVCISLRWLKLLTSCKWNPSMQSLVRAATTLRQVPNISLRGRMLSSGSASSTKQSWVKDSSVVLLNESKLILISYIE